jgi:putative spermidine/putrescine transport system ATP-binding protein
LSGQARPFAVRAENIRLLRAEQPAEADSMTCTGEILDVQYHGATSRWQVRLDTGELLAAETPDATNGDPLRVGERVRLMWPREAATSLAETRSGNGEAVP